MPDPTGETIRIANQPFTVVGVLERKGQSAIGQDQDDTVIVPYTTVMKKLSGNTWLSNITVAAENESQISQVADRISDAAAPASSAVLRRSGRLHRADARGDDHAS